MNLHEKNVPAAEPWRLAEGLVDAAVVDTVYGDLYLQRARSFLHPALNEADFAALQRLETEVLNLPNRISVAMEQTNWVEVKALSARMSTLKRTLTEKESLHQLGKKIYQPGEPALDPFSPGLQGLAKKSELRELLPKFSARLEQLQGADAAEWKEFYAARRSALAALSGRLSPAQDEAASSGARLDGAQLKHKAFEALNSGDFDKLEKMAALIGQDEQGTTKTVAGPRSDFSGNLPNLTFEFSPQVVSRARDLGLVAVRMDAGSRVLNLSPDELAPLYRHLWHPAFTDDIGQGGSGRQKDIPLPAHAPAGLRDLVEQFTLYPFVNSGGARFVPVLAEEDVLVEDFEEPEPGAEPPSSALLTALGFDDRRGITRIRLEKALSERGNAIVEDLGLDARRFRLVCIPPDVYGRIGQQQGWGRQQLWTHFDGYLVRRNGKLQALAGGDVRFGGLFDLLGISRDYDSDKIIVRFAVVQRRRLETVG